MRQTKKKSVRKMNGSIYEIIKRVKMPKEKTLFGKVMDNERPSKG